MEEHEGIGENFGKCEEAEDKELPQSLVAFVPDVAYGEIQLGEELEFELTVQREMQNR